MAKNESTAINQLINLVSTATPRKLAPDEDLMFTPPPRTKAKPASNSRMTGTLAGAGEVEPLPRGRGAMGTQQSSLTPPVRVTTAPPSRAMTIPPLGTAAALDASSDVPMLFEDTPLPPPVVSEDSAPWSLSPVPPVVAGRVTRPSLPPPSRTTPPPASMPVVAPFSSSAKPHASVDLTDQSWFEESRAVERVDHIPAVSAVEDSFGTAEVPKRATTAQWLIKLALPMGAMIVIGVFVGGYLAFGGQGGHKRSAKSSPSSVALAAPLTQDSAPAESTTAAPVVMKVEPAAAEPVKVEPTTVEPAKVEPTPVAVAAVEPTPAVAAPVIAGKHPVYVDVRLDSNPSGATVMLVDRGKTTFLGTTPISTAVDPSRQYDLVFTYKDRPTHLEHLDARTTTKLAVKIERRSGSESARLAAAPKQTESPTDPARVAKPEKVAKTEAPIVKAEAPVAKAEPAGEGMLMISSKPPCEILIDGKPTGLMTPQRALPLSAGAHKVTLVNTAEKIKKTLSIQITADQPTKVIQDLMNK